MTPTRRRLGRPSPGGPGKPCVRPIQRRSALSRDAHEIQRAERNPSREGNRRTFVFRWSPTRRRLGKPGPGGRASLERHRSHCAERNSSQEGNRRSFVAMGRRHAADLASRHPEGRAGLACALSRDAAPYPRTRTKSNVQSRSHRWKGNRRAFVSRWPPTRRRLGLQGPGGRANLERHRIHRAAKKPIAGRNRSTLAAMGRRHTADLASRPRRAGRALCAPYPETRRPIQRRPAP